MAIDEAIAKYRENARYFKRTTNVAYALELEQIAEWLEELKTIKEMDLSIPQHFTKEQSGWIKAYCIKRNIEFYNKALDDFVEKIIRYVDCGHLCSPTEMRWSDLSVVEMVKKLAEQLKESD